MKRVVSVVRNTGQWIGFGAWSFFWMSAAILSRVVFDANVALSWARRFWAPGLVWITGCDLKVAPGFVPRPGQPYVFAMNHQSMFDIVVAFTAIPVNIRFVAKQILRAIPFLGWYMISTGMIFVDRRRRAQAVQSLNEACDKIRAGASILVYPEGTRAQEGGPILPFKKGPFVMAIQAGVPIVPVAIEGGSRLLPKSSLRVTPGTVRFVMGEPIPTAGLTEEDREDLMRRVRDAIIDLHVRIGGAGGDKGQAVACAGLEGVAQPQPKARERRRPAPQQMNVA
jgi:1-acyl-sn-glycerol-3-phosphate acyltransferase